MLPSLSKASRGGLAAPRRAPDGRLRSLAALVVFVACFATPGLHAAKLYRWTDAKGVRHYLDHAPRGSPTKKSVRVVPVAASPSSIAELRTVSVPRGFQAIADNRLAGPVEVRLEFARNDNVRADPVLPSRTVVPAHSSTVLALIEAVDTTRAGGFEVRMDVIPGDPDARAADVEYLLPLHLPQFRIEQGFGGTFSHNDEQNRYALDFAAPIGTPVYAAREGVVMEVESDFARAGLNLERYGGRANQVRILHDDGTMGVYAHLDTDGVIVRVGQRVRAGQQIGLSGNTGFTTGPHLHFAVQVNRGMRLESIRFRMRGPQGPMRLSGN